MPRGTPKAGFRRTKKYWNEVAATQSLQDIEKNLANKVPYIVAELEKLTKPITCANCGHTIKVIDKDVGMYLIDRVLGKPTQRHEVDITETIQLSGDDIDRLVARLRIAERASLPIGEGDIIEGEVKEV